MAESLQSGFAVFNDTASRDLFITQVLSNNGDLLSHAYLPVTRPEIVFENLSPSEQKQIVALLEGVGRWVDDVQFNATS